MHRFKSTLVRTWQDNGWHPINQIYLNSAKIMILSIIFHNRNLYIFWIYVYTDITHRYHLHLIVTSQVLLDLMVQVIYMNIIFYMIIFHIYFAFLGEALSSLLVLFLLFFFFILHLFRLWNLIHRITMHAFLSFIIFFHVLALILSLFLLWLLLCTVTLWNIQYIYELWRCKTTDYRYHFLM